MVTTPRRLWSCLGSPPISVVRILVGDDWAASPGGPNAATSCGCSSPGYDTRFAEGGRVFVAGIAPIFVSDSYSVREPHESVPACLSVATPNW